MDQLPVEVTTGILSRLPARYVLLCRCVCKTWKEMIDGHQFAPMHFTRSLESDDNSTFLIVSRNYHVLYMTEEEDEVSKTHSTTKIEFSGPNPGNYFAFTNPCSGFFGFAVWGSNESTSYYTYNIYNPVTKECVKLPDFSCAFSQIYVHTLGLGLDPATNSFKVVLTFYPWNGFHYVHETQALVFTLGSSDSWRNLDNFPKVECFEFSPCFFNGSLHWLSEGGRILCFDLTSELFSFIEIPQFNSPSLFDVFHRMGLVMLDGCLSLCDCLIGGDIELWVMKDYKVEESWSKLVIKRACLEEFSYLLLPITLWKNGGEILLYDDSGILVSYEIESGICTQLQINGLPTKSEDGLWNCQFCIYPYVGNLMKIMPPRQLAE